MKQWVDNWKRLAPVLENLAADELCSDDYGSKLETFIPTIDWVCEHAVPRKTSGLVEQAPEVLRLYPEFGTVVSDFDDPMVREIRVFKYRIIYRIREDENEIEIMIVVHGSRRLTGDMIE